jgi:hypothetical protein
MTREPSPAEIHAVVHYEDGVLTWKNAELQDAADAVRIKREQIHNEFAAHHDLLMEAGH